MGTQVHLRVTEAAAAVVAARREAAAFRGRPGRRQEPLQRHPHRSRPGHPEGAGAMTTATQSPYKSDRTASNMCGFTLMNNQVGVVIAEVMAGQDNVTVTPLPSM